MCEQQIFDHRLVVESQLTTLFVAQQWPGFSQTDKKEESIKHKDWGAVCEGNQFRSEKNADNLDVN